MAEPYSPCAVKSRYTSPQAAKRAIKVTRAMHPKIKLHWYRCESCRDWHLSGTKHNDI